MIRQIQSIPSKSQRLYTTIAEAIAIARADAREGRKFREEFRLACEFIRDVTFQAYCDESVLLAERAVDRSASTAKGSAPVLHPSTCSS